jgi:hypothetical protein
LSPFDWAQGDNEFKTFCQAERACPELDEGKTDEKHFRISELTIVTLRQAQDDIEFKT